MDQALDYLRHAEQCMEQARNEHDPKKQEELLELAYHWTMLAVEREALLKERFNTRNRTE
jgi:hypothetical protein